MKLKDSMTENTKAQCIQTELVGLKRSLLRLVWFTNHNVCHSCHVSLWTITLQRFLNTVYRQ